MKHFFSIITDILLVFLILILIFNIFSIFYAKKKGVTEPVNLFGYSFYIDASDSMAPAINKGDLIVAKAVKIADLKENDIIIYYDTENDIYITHRITEVLSNNEKVELKTKGDKNNTEDIQLVTEKDVKAKYIFKVGGFGNLLLFFSTTLGIVVFYLIIATIFLIIYLFSILNKKN